MQGGQTFGKHLLLSIGDGGGSHHASELFMDLEFNKSAFETEYFLNRLEALNTGLRVFVFGQLGENKTKQIIKTVLWHLLPTFIC